MHIIQEEIGLPVFSASSGARGDSSHKVFSISPLPPGFGMTLGNSLRRVLLSSLPGAAITSLRVRGAQHEYSALKGVKESLVDIVLNLKQVKLKKHSKDVQTISLSVKGPKVVTAKDLELPSDIELMNPDLVLMTIEKGGAIDAEMTVEKGVGYEMAAERNRKHHEAGLIHIDSIFSPVEKVKYEVLAARVGQRTNLEKLIIEVQTNGSLTAEDAMQFSSQLLQSYFGYFGSDKKTVEPEFMADFSRTAAPQAEESTSSGSPTKESYTPIEILNLSPRTLNALINAGVGSIEQLTKCTESILSNFRGFGAKALDEVKATLASRGLSLASEGEE
jgi:DNA-directed RNA polymerase subunit alpha